MTNLTCFWHPKLGYFDLSLDDRCEDCGREMRHPLTHLPVESIRDYEVVSAIDRGYYSATFAARGPLGQMVCLKVIPKAIYALRGKDFRKESVLHASIAEGTQHLVNIRDAFDFDVTFSGDSESMPCHIAVLDYVQGESLRAKLEQPDLAATAIAQIAVDLLRLLQELENKQVYHNDLHAGNILVQTLPSEAQRGGDAIDSYTKAVAVDLGSVLDASRSDESTQVADNHQVTTHLMRLALQATPDPASAPDLEFRLALALNEIADLLRPDNLAQRAPNYTDLITNIHSAFITASSPWMTPPAGLSRFGDSFNAQTMRPWFVPRLLVDPDGEWQRRIESPGPMVITGMRGCGKTMLLRALQFHARASVGASDSSSTEMSTDAAIRLRQDGYVGLYVSCNRLLDGLGKPDGPLHEPHTRLFLCYAREALQALRHLTDIAGRSSVSPAAPLPIASVISLHVTGSDIKAGDDIHVLERKILKMLRSLESGAAVHRLESHPAIAMPALATAITECTDVWSGARVLFLLDDVSTRHLNEESIQALLSSLMFPSETCAFKVTTEAQTLELVLKSPGLVETARIGRDYETFDLASAIYSKLRDNNGRAGRDFVANVLQQRADLTATHPERSPRELLGDRPLIEISRQIASSTETSSARKDVYFGMSALAAVCVGDIGDVISIYELILARAGGSTAIPIAPAHQSGAFQEFCSRRLYQLSRRKGRLKLIADGFAKASHDLLVQSARRNDGSRIRDYASIYVRVTSGDIDGQLLQLRELMDAGVFVLTGGPDAPRTKTRDSDPIAQYTLTFRKLLGLSNAIGLTQRDRFELSGQNLIDFLESPENSREILKKNLAAGRSGTATFVSAPGPAPRLDEIKSSSPTATRAAAAPQTLFESVATTRGVESPPAAITANSAPLETVPYPDIINVDNTKLADLHVNTLVTALGFEDRALISTQRALSALTPNRVVAITYPSGPGGIDFENALDRSGAEVSYVDADSPIDFAPSSLPSLSAIDTTGMTKPHIYHAVRSLLSRDGAVVVVHTEAEEYYPLNEDVGARLSLAPDDDYARLEACGDILTGEKRPYHFVSMHSADVDDGRRRVLLASSSAKHERLFSLLEERDYDHVEILIPEGSSPRKDLARLAARVAAKDFHSSRFRQVGSSSATDVLAVARATYEEFYKRANFNFEVGLTGSKLHTVALAAASTALKFSQAWYVRPDEFDPARFTTGAGNTSMLLITSPRARESG